MQNNKSTVIDWTVCLGGPAEVVRQATMVLSASAPASFRESKVVEFVGPGERYQIALDSSATHSSPADVFLLKQYAGAHGMKAHQVGRHAARFEGIDQSELKTARGTYALYPFQRSSLNLREVYSSVVDEGMTIFGHAAHHLGSSHSVTAWRMLQHRKGTAPAFPIFGNEGAFQTFDSQRETIYLAQVADGDGQSARGSISPESETQFRRDVFDDAGYVQYAVQSVNVERLAEILAEKFPQLVVAAVYEGGYLGAESGVWVCRDGKAKNLVPSVNQLLGGDVDWFNDRYGRDVKSSPSNARECKCGQLMLAEAAFLKAVSQSVRSHQALRLADHQAWASHQVLSSIRREGLQAWLEREAREAGASIDEVADRLISMDPRGAGGYGVADACIAHENLLMQPAALNELGATEHEWVDKVADLMHPRQQHYPLVCLPVAAGDEAQRNVDGVTTYTIGTAEMDGSSVGSEPALLLLERVAKSSARPGPNVMARILASNCGMLGSSQAGHFLGYAVLMDVTESTAAGVRALLSELRPQSDLVCALKGAGERLSGQAPPQSSFRVKSDAPGQSIVIDTLRRTMDDRETSQPSYRTAAIRDALAQEHGMVCIRGDQIQPVSSQLAMSDRFISALTTLRLRSAILVALSRERVERCLPDDYRRTNAAAALIGAAATTWGDAVPEVREMLFQNGVPRGLVLRSIAASAQRIENFCVRGGDPHQLVPALAELHQTFTEFKSCPTIDTRQGKRVPDSVRETMAKMMAFQLMTKAASGEADAVLAPEADHRGDASISAAQPSRRRIRL